ncbi:hypothetical protein [Chryseobacterium sp.]|uniref:hypothetical protein n=1 Tax=Chryseobacterium sp. TaxID=1871047 RepID=UPI0025BBB291|nr:hypothetical protein [Chryseobacterium sp.]
MSYRRRVFRKKIVYYLAVTVSLMLFIFSAMLIFALFKNFNIFTLLFVGGAIILNAFAFINLVEKYDKAVLFLNLSISLFILFTVYLAIISFLNREIERITDAPSLKYLVFFTVFLIIINRYKAEVNYSEIEEIGKQEE